MFPTPLWPSSGYNEQIVGVVNQLQSIELWDFYEKGKMFLTLQFSVHCESFWSHHRVYKCSIYNSLALITENMNIVHKVTV